MRSTFAFTLMALLGVCLMGCSPEPTVTEQAVLGKWQASLDVGWDSRSVVFTKEGKGFVKGVRPAIGLNAPLSGLSPSQESDRLDFTYEVDPKDNVVRIYPKGDKDRQGTARLISQDELEMKVDAFLLVLGLKCTLHRIPSDGDIAGRSVYTRDEFTKAVVGKTEQQVVDTVGQPGLSRPLVKEPVWFYYRKTKDPATGLLDDSAEVDFKNGIVESGLLPKNWSRWYESL